MKPCRRCGTLASLPSTKTGTVTQGRPTLTDLVVAEGFDRDTVLRLTAAVEASSEHPIGGAIVEAL